MKKNIIIALVIMLLVSCAHADAQETPEPPRVQLVETRTFESLAFANNEDPLPRGEHILLAMVMHLPTEVDAQLVCDLVSTSSEIEKMINGSMPEGDDPYAWSMARPVEEYRHYKDYTEQWFAVSVFNNVAYDTSILYVVDDNKIFVIMGFTIATDAELLTMRVADHILSGLIRTGEDVDQLLPSAAEVGDGFVLTYDEEEQLT